MTDRISAPDIRRAVAGLVGRGYVPPPSFQEEHWLADFGAIPAPAFHAAVAEYIRLDGKGQYWPRPGQILQHVRTGISSRIPPSLVAPDDRTHGWYVIRSAPDGPPVRYLSHQEARVRGLGRPEDAECPEEGCGCFAVEVALPASDFGVSKAVAARSAIAEAFAHPRGWLWAHTASARNLAPWGK